MKDPLYSKFSNTYEKDHKVLDIQTWQKNRFPVQAVQVTADNMQEVAKWCDGEIRSTMNRPPADYIHVRVHTPMNERQTRAYVGDWVLYAPTGYKVYSNKAFLGNFHKDNDMTQVSLDNFGRHPVTVNVYGASGSGGGHMEEVVIGAKTPTDEEVEEVVTNKIGGNPGGSSTLSE